MIARARAFGLIAALALPTGATAQQPRSPTVFSPAQNGSLSIRAAVVLADYTVRPLPLIPVVARRTDRPDSVTGRTDLDGRLAMTLPAGAYTIRAHTPLPVAGRSFMWAVPVVIRPSMAEAIQLTNANASADSILVAAEPARPAATNRRTVDAEPAAIDPARGASSAQTADRDRSVAGAPVAEAPPASTSYVTPGDGVRIMVR